MPVGPVGATPAAAPGTRVKKRQSMCVGIMELGVCVSRGVIRLGSNVRFAWQQNSGEIVSRLSASSTSVRKPVSQTSCGFRMRQQAGHGMVPARARSSTGKSCRAVYGFGNDLDPNCCHWPGSRLPYALAMTIHSHEPRARQSPPRAGRLLFFVQCRLTGCHPTAFFRAETTHQLALQGQALTTR